MTKERERGEVLVVLDDDWMAALLKGHLGHAGLRVHHAGEAREGYRLARTVMPDCIVVNDELPDIDGFWVIDRVRRDPGAVSTVPVLLLTENVDDVRGAEVGADLLLKKPLDNEEVVAQVQALLELSKRLRGKREQRDSYAPRDGGGQAALRGDLAQMSVTTILTVLEMERRTGTLSVEGASKGQQMQSAELALSNGAVVSAQLAGKNVSAIDVLRHMLRLERGKFWFAPGEPKNASGQAQSLGMLMLEAARLEDEGR